MMVTTMKDDEEQRQGSIKNDKRVDFLIILVVVFCVCVSE